MYNKQDIHSWALQNLRCAAEVQHQVRCSINIWCGIYKNRLVVKVFYESKLMGSGYLELLEYAKPDFVEDLPLNDLWNLWLQHDGALSHKILSVQQYH